MRSRRSGPLAATAIWAASAQPFAAQPPAPSDQRWPSLFISPSGQPFRSAPGEPCPAVRP
jgi:hypothetical protein